MGAGGGNSEELVFGEGGGGRVGVARRAGWKGTLGRPRYISGDDPGCFVEVAQTPDHALLVVTEAKSHKRRLIIAAEVTADGHVGAARRVERWPPGPNSSDEVGGWALDDAGRELVATSPEKNFGEEEPTAIWLHGATRRCPAFSRTLFLHTANEDEREEASPEIFAGAHGVFHLVWAQHGQLQTATARVRCARG